MRQCSMTCKGKGFHNKTAPSTTSATVIPASACMAQEADSSRVRCDHLHLLSTIAPCEQDYGLNETEMALNALDTTRWSRITFWTEIFEDF